MIIKGIKYLKGYVRIRVTGKFPERFINLCAHHDIYIWDIAAINNGYELSVSKKAFFMLRPMLKKAKCRLKIIGKKGLPFKRKSLVRRSFFLISFTISVVIVFGLTQFIWRIDIAGNQQYTTEELISYLDKENIAVSSFKKGIKIGDVEDLLFNRFDHINYVSCEIKGTQLLINIKEELNKIDKVEEGNPCDIVANQGGEIDSIIARNGTPVVKKGDQVEKGDLLISSTIEIYEYNQLIYVNFVHSEGDVYIKRTIPYTNEIDYKYFHKEYDEEEIYEFKTIELLNRKIDMIVHKGNTKKVDVIDKRKQIEPIAHFYLPVFIIKHTVKPYIEIEKKYTKEEIEKELEYRLVRELEKLKKEDVQIGEINVVYSHTNLKGHISATVEIVEKIGAEKAINEVLRRQEYDQYNTEEDGDTP